MSDFDTLANQYIELWNETDPDERARRVRSLWSEDGEYIDPLAAARGRDAIAATICAVQEQFPGMRFALRGSVDAHHDQARFTWELGPAGEPAVIVGSDVAVRDADGRLALVLGFLDQVAAA
ncbi:nuclear transport factor 2 family protein [Speluncibacter jeojiensis]|uniref:Nuclear transport factor 2 family protein n=1 Tax=Speluncibacter jeojiensis TaxID=2710754 RepID=A0A9X4LZH1_9ACTN|nr:nuclear transport factor 2 family protein [Corynebacteriales bacterium D3-21]